MKSHFCVLLFKSCFYSRFYDISIALDLVGPILRGQGTYYIRAALTNINFLNNSLGEIHSILPFSIRGNP